MRRVVAAALAITLTSGAALPQAATATASSAAATAAEARDMNATLDALHDAASKADGARYFGLYAPDAVFIGTDVKERWTLAEFRAYAQPHFSKGKGWTYRARQRRLTLGPDPCRCVAWFDEVLDSESYGTARGTGVLVKRPEAWRVAQYALTFPMPNELAKGFTEAIKAHEAKAAPAAR